MLLLSSCFLANGFVLSNDNLPGESSDKPDQLSRKRVNKPDLFTPVLVEEVNLNC